MNMSNIVLFLLEIKGISTGRHSRYAIYKH